MRISSVLVCLVSAVVSVNLVGCSTNSTPPPSVAAKSPVSDVPTIQRSPEFASVGVAFRAGKYSEALKQITTLSQRPDITPADHLYLDQQAQICRSRLSGNTPPVPVSENSVPQSVPAQRADCGPQALFFLCREANIPASLSALTRVAGTRPGEGTSMAGLSKAAQSVGFGTKGVQMDLDALHHLKPPAIAWVDSNHYIAITRIKGEQAIIFDSNHP